MKPQTEALINISYRNGQYEAYYDSIYITSGVIPVHAAKSMDNILRDIRNWLVTTSGETCRKPVFAEPQTMFVIGIPVKTLVRWLDSAFDPR